MDPFLPYEFTFAAEGEDGSEISTVLDESMAQEAKPGSGVFCWYVIEMLKGRTGEITGKLRFDICPGSNVRVESGGAGSVIGDELREDLFATVVQVSYVIDTENGRAATGFSLAHARTPFENEQEGTSVSKPPFYQSP